MFTGLIEKLGVLARMDRRGDGYRLSVEHPAWDTPLSLGESVSVNGACLTVTGVGPGWFNADILAETARRTSLADRVGGKVNLERAMQAGGRFGGHFVTGHVDGVGTVVRMTPSGDDHVLTVGCPAELMAEIAGKGSVACDGVSLTVAGVGSESFDVHLIPFSWEHTALKFAVQGTRVNIETDLVAKYVRRLISGRESGGGGVTLEHLHAAGVLVGP